MPWLGFYDVRTFAPLPVDFVLTDKLRAAIIVAGKDTLRNLREKTDFDSAAHFMAFCDGMWLFNDLNSEQAEFRHFFPGFFNDDLKQVFVRVLQNV